MADHPIAPPPELVEQWRNLPECVSQLRTVSMVTITTEKLQDIATGEATLAESDRRIAAKAIQWAWGQHAAS